MAKHKKGRKATSRIDFANFERVDSVSYLCATHLDFDVDEGHQVICIEALSDPPPGGRTGPRRASCQGPHSLDRYSEKKFSVF